ncbi:MAG: putative membrane protein [Pseudolabrys sp.]|jgi:uncharacterized membrane protein YhaH (DUF805 family)|nr:putative membrane protein [Pseudolabrys sp.]
MVVGGVDLVELLTTYQGRINRARYWIAVLCFVCVAIALAILGFILAILGSVGGILLIVISVVVYIAMIIAGIFVGIKRLHDREKSGWWLLLFMLAPSVLMALGHMIGLGIVFSLAAFAISIWAFVELGCLRGTVGPNPYGADPLPGPG